MKTLKAIIVDDERLARRELRTLLQDFDSVQVIGESDNLDETVELIKTKSPDVVFLDIQLRNENGFDLLEKTEHDFKLVFVSAFDEFAIRAFEINALDYLLKPVNPERLAKAIERLLEDDGEEEGAVDDLRMLEIDDRLLLEVEGRSRFIQISEISHIRASGDYSEVYMRGGKYSLIEKPLAEWDKRLPTKHFARIHRSTIINLNEVDKMESLFNRTMEVYLKQFPTPFSASRRYAAKLREKFG